LAKIALELERALVRRAELGMRGAMTDRVLAHGQGWSVRDVICTAGPGDHAFEESHSCVYIAVVAVGSFQYRSLCGEELMTPGSLLLGNAGQFFTCGHEHGTGDRCLSFGYTPEYFERIVADTGIRSADAGFRVLRVPPLRDLAPVVTRAMTGLARSADAPDSDVLWEELALRLAAQTLRLSACLSTDATAMPPAAVARVTRAVRRIEQHPDMRLSLATLARDARLSPYHFLRIFERLTGVTPHQYILRTRLREAALRLASAPTKILELALDCGFGDVSNFNRAFRAEFGCAPRAYLRQNSTGYARRRNGRATEFHRG
jgi:AraC family transcriptional regulator